MAVLIKKEMITHQDSHINGRWYYFSVKSSSLQKPLLFLNLYSPCAKQQGFTIEIYNSLTRFPNYYHIIGGDWNAIIDPVTDRTSRSKTSNTQASLVLNDLKTDCQQQNSHTILSVINHGPDLTSF